MHKCKYCGNEFDSASKLGGHIIWCKDNPNRSGKSNFNSNIKNGVRKIDIQSMDLFCQYCGKQCKSLNSLRQHEIRCKNNPNRIDTFNSYNNIIEYNNKISQGDVNVTPKRNRYTKAEYYGLEKPKVSEEVKNKLSQKAKLQKWSEERKKNLSNAMKNAVKNNPNSYSSNNICGRVKRYLYNGVYLHGNWELKFAKFLDFNNIFWKRPEEGIEYLYNNDIHLYFPDFYLPDYDIYIEVKGYKRERDEYKWKSLKNIKVITKNEIKLIEDNLFDIDKFLIS